VVHHSLILDSNPPRGLPGDSGGRASHRPPQAVVNRSPPTTRITTSRRLRNPRGRRPITAPGIALHPGPHELICARRRPRRARFDLAVSGERPCRLPGPARLRGFALKGPERLRLPMRHCTSTGALRGLPLSPRHRRSRPRWYLSANAAPEHTACRSSPLSRFLRLAPRWSGMLRSSDWSDGRSRHPDDRVTKRRRCSKTSSSVLGARTEPCLPRQKR